ncbi:UDP-N-acetylmuramate dehydrogenase [Lebetimonas natsushimae]|uniref:UDP-N-acetylenolpyruvoylglucosamine reductase n=1 Tax=Lebetimonas natsushimae TaxID=1936991 RepID=A0A292Y872_9BACT|nr:UDP-N-acetylmuramate dehydrogenase [Lebetimonas natsushimae]GAX86982.1 UDP-N-acetylmuramate dehydrogenase [Lebetimonas natsushimae]
MKNEKWKIIDFSKFSSIKIGPKIKVKIIDENNYNGEFLIGRATNTLISQNAKNLGILSDKYKFIEYKNGLLKVGAKVKNRMLYNFCKRNNIGGFEFLSHLPGTIGGSIKMNAGVKNEEISNNLVSIKTINGWIKKKDINFSYRYSNIETPVFEAVFEIKRDYDPELDEYLKNLRSNQPKAPSLGSVFKNPKDDFAGRLIEAAGLKGEKKGDIQISPIHGNFFVNLGKGTFEDMIYLIELTKKRVYEKFRIKLEEEIKIIF